MRTGHYIHTLVTVVGVATSITACGSSGPSMTATPDADEVVNDAPVSDAEPDAMMLLPLAEVTAGEYFTCARESNGSAKCWGNNFQGHLGDGTNEVRYQPTSVLGLSTALSISAGFTHACARKAGNTVACWGRNIEGQVGAGVGDALAPRDVPGFAGALEVTTGGFHSCVRRAAGEILCTGYNNYGQIGDTTRTDRRTPVVALASSSIVQLAAGGTHTCGRHADGTVSCWGSDIYGQIGDNATNADRPSPTVVPGLTNVAFVAAGGDHTCAVKVGGSVLCWGRNQNGQLGDGSKMTRAVPTPIAGITNAVSITAGHNHTCALLTTGAVSCWGAPGLVGDGTNNEHTTPTSIGLAGVTSLAAGGYHTCAVIAGGSMKCWGNNINGQLGDGTTDPRNVPTTVTGL